MKKKKKRKKERTLTRFFLDVLISRFYSSLESTYLLDPITVLLHF